MQGCPTSLEALRAHQYLADRPAQEQVSLMVEMVRYVVAICRHHAGLEDSHPLSIGVSRGSFGWVPWVEIVEKIRLKFGFWVTEEFLAAVLVVDPHRIGAKPFPRLEYLVTEPDKTGEIADEGNTVDLTNYRDVPQNPSSSPTCSGPGASYGTESSNLALDLPEGTTADQAPASKRVRNCSPPLIAGTETGCGRRPRTKHLGSASNP